MTGGMHEGTSQCRELPEPHPSSAEDLEIRVGIGLYTSVDCKHQKRGYIYMTSLPSISVISFAADSIEVSTMLFLSLRGAGGGRRASMLSISLSSSSASSAS